MTHAVRLVAAKNRTPTWAIVVFFLAAVMLILFGSWMMWQSRQSNVDLGRDWGFYLFIAGVSFGGDGGRRLAVNRVIDEMLAALDRVD